MPPEPPHGTRAHPTSKHPVLDIAFWEQEFPLEPGERGPGWIDGPGDIAIVEQARRVAAARGDLGPSVPADIFTWSYGAGSQRPWLTKIGGQPWRDTATKWPRDLRGPLHFLGQICLADSRDILPPDLPGDVVLFFGRRIGNDATVSRIEWSSTNGEYGRPDFHPERELPFCYTGVIHRTVQYTDREAADAAFAAAGWEDSYGFSAVQATSIGAYADIPQGWPFEEGDGNTLIAMFSSFSFVESWPLCNVPRRLQVVRPDGSEYSPMQPELGLMIEDAGAACVYRDGKGRYKVNVAGG